ncbi:hypothetical protein U14_02714 [Candidatus Moduliflexus flocculans]|uniref:Uncharacterized protein n=1 Tax=Candidatus Moduliflexus flocculans TaxID=1499966 RepID=A0A081BM54_9BACT|nr:hypothetical protein U14_02714 [Candidatus Moduliflexus flocculans]
MITTNLLSVLELAKASLPDSLVDAEGYALLALAAERLPFELATFWGFECRLGEASAKMDILFEIKRQSQGRNILAGEMPSTLDALCAQWPAWKNLRRFATLWANPHHAFSTHIRNLWLEFDTAAIDDPSQADEILSRPCIFFGPNAKTLQKEQDAHLICEALSALENPIYHEDALNALIKELPGEARIFQIGIMLSRPNPGLRVCVYPLTAEEIPVWLRAVGWQGNPENIADILRQLPQGLESFAMNINLMPDGPAEKIGVECYMNWLENDPKQWIPLLDATAAMHLCLPSKYQGILDFQGMTHFPKDWPRPAEGIAYQFLLRKIHHIKLSITSGQAKEAKAYLALSHPGLNANAIFSKNAGGAWLVE